MSMSAKDQSAKDQRHAILLSSIEYCAKKQSLRPLLEDGSATHVEATIEGKVGRGKVNFGIFGTLNVGSPTAVNSTSSAPTLDIVSALLTEIPYELRVKVIQKLISKFDAGKLNQADDETKAAAKGLLAKLKSTTPATRAGAVSFSME